jgi:soluble lytic murein transglycosylase-like protein
MKLPAESFIRKEVVEEAAQALPPPTMSPAGIVQQVNENTPQYWYDKLKLPKLEMEFQLPRGILLHLIDIESKGNPNATSKAGAKSLFGIMPAGKSGFKGDINDPAATALFAAKTLKYLIQHFGGIEPGLAAYNWGMGNLARKGLHRAPKQTKHYIKFFKSKGIIPQNGSYAKDSWGEEDVRPADSWETRWQ